MGFNAVWVAASRPTVEGSGFLLALFRFVVVSILGVRLILKPLSSLGCV